MATYTITSAGTGLKVVDDSGRGRYLPRPGITLSPSATYPLAQPSLELRSGPSALLITLADTVTVNGSAGAATLLDLFNQITAILPGATKAEYAEVPTYAALLALPAVTVMTTVKVANDANKGQTDTVYQLWPSGRRKWLAAADDN